MGVLSLLSLAAGAAIPSAALRRFAALESARRADSDALASYQWKDFVSDFNRLYGEGTKEWNERKEIFEQRLQEVLEFNAQPDNSWKMGISKFMDYTEREKSRVLGYKGSGTRRPGRTGRAEATQLRRENLPESYDVSKPDQVLLKIIRDQGNCGSCWAEAATSTLEGQMEVNQTLMNQIKELRTKSSKVPGTPTLASQVVVSCTPNERHCGGKGGCSGATVELAYDMVKKEGGLPFAVEWSYESGMSGNTPSCQAGVFNHHKIGISKYTVLPSNKFEPLKAALFDSGGPIAVSVDASNWFMYASGIYTDGAQGQFTVNHAVTLVAYQSPQGGSKGYWKIKNSWGNYWGEEGYIRLEMKPNEEEHCGWDHNTHDGLACDGDPDTAWVCGTCGVLYDSVYPTGMFLVE